MLYMSIVIIQLPVLGRCKYVTFLQVTVPKGSLSHLSVKVNVGFPPDAVYNIVTDPDNKRVFKNIQVKVWQVSVIFFVLD